MWIQCLNPPLPDGLGLAFDDPNQETQPIEFFDNVTYVCSNNALFFEEDRNIDSFEIQCYDDGTFDAPNPWPRCISSKIIHEDKNMYFLSLFSLFQTPMCNVQNPL